MGAKKEQLQQACQDMGLSSRLSRSGAGSQTRPKTPDSAKSKLEGFFLIYLLKTCPCTNIRETPCNLPNNWPYPTIFYTMLSSISLALLLLFKKSTYLLKFDQILLPPSGKEYNYENHAGQI
jgi:hypothetical protein